MSPAFGTSGLRGLATELTAELVTDVVRAFLASCHHGGSVLVGWDLRASSPAIAQTVLDAVAAAGLRGLRAGTVPTPALALAAARLGCGAIMVTGSHIPADRNGLKFYTTLGEISKIDEAAILGARGQNWPIAPDMHSIADAPYVGPDYASRYVAAFGPRALAGLRIGVYQHSSVARDMIMQVFADLGAVPVALARADHFIPVDTEAVAPQTRAQFAAWCAAHALDALVSTDGDADRPLLCDAQGQVVAGDVLGVLTARALGADVVCTPVSSNAMQEMMPQIKTVVRTKIGSPHVIAAMNAALAQNPAARVVGYEANGGFLLGFWANGPAGGIAPLMTRDCLLPIIAPLASAHSMGAPIADLVQDLPPIFTAADRLQNIPAAATTALIQQLIDSPSARATFFQVEGAETRVDVTDGLRVYFEGAQVVHLRPSGNAPECRCYAQASSPALAQTLVDLHLGQLRHALNGIASFAAIDEKTA